MDDLDRWTRVMPLGAGAFGEVHLAWDRLDGRWVALKRFTGQDELGLLRMVIESRIRVSHPHLVRTVAFRLVDDRAWLVTELARGGSLRTLMTRTGVLPWGWVAEAVDQVLAALTALHATGVVHRDLKPANLLLRSVGAEPPHLLVGDFGIATWRTVSMTGIGAAIGTPGYLAPEYLDGHQPSPATDVFAVGVLAAELLTGQRLVHYSNASPTMPSTWSDVLPVPPEVPRPLAAVLQRMADPNPDRRYRDSTQAREALLSAVPPAARPTLPAVVVSDLLANLPPGWTEEGPEPSTALLSPATSDLDATQQAATPQQATPTPEPNPARRSDPPSMPSPSVASPAASPSSALPATASSASTSAPPATPKSAESVPAGSVPAGSASSGSVSAESISADSEAAASVVSAVSSAAAPSAAASSSTPGSTAPSAVTSTPNLTALPIDGGPTALILENKTALEPDATAASPAAPPAPASGSSSSPLSGSATFLGTPPTGSPTHPPTGSPTPPTTPPTGSPTPPPTGSATPTPTPPRGSATATKTDARREAKAKAKARRRRKAKRAFLLVVLILFASGAGTLWWAANHRAIPGHPTAVGATAGRPAGTSRWEPTIVEGCALVEVDSTRLGENGTERCQRTPDLDPPQHWVEAPPAGFPKSNAGGPFPNESCTADGDRDYSPVGDHVECENGTWRAIA